MQSGCKNSKVDVKLDGITINSENYILHCKATISKNIFLIIQRNQYKTIFHGNRTNVFLGDGLSFPFPLRLKFMFSYVGIIST